MVADDREEEGGQDEGEEERSRAAPVRRRTDDFLLGDDINSRDQMSQRGERGKEKGEKGSAWVVGWVQWKVGVEDQLPEGERPKGRLGPFGASTLDSGAGHAQPGRFQQYRQIINRKSGD